VWYAAHPRHARFKNQDALGLLHLEERIADWFWPGFSSRTTRVGYYVVVLYGLSLADRAAEMYGLPRDDDTRRLLFSRFERLWGVSLWVAGQGVVAPQDEFLGQDGVTAVCQERGQARPIDFLHLQQGEVGALAAYLPSLRVHQLVAPDRLRLTPLGWDIAQWMWDEPQSDRAGWDDFVLKALDPRQSTIPPRVGRIDLKALGDRARLSRFSGRSDLLALLWRRLFADRPPPAALAVLPSMAENLRGFHAAGITAPREILDVLARGKGIKGGGLQHAAQVAVCISDLGGAMLRIFDRVHQTLLREGYVADWSDCVQAAVTRDLVECLNAQMAQYRGLSCNEEIEALSACGSVFGQVMRRFNTQNPYNTFESILHLHMGSNRALSQGEGWIARVGERVYLRQASTEYGSNELLRWQPTFRMAVMGKLLAELGQLS
jgi:hypothetical protein